MTEYRYSVDYDPDPDLSYMDYPEWEGVEKDSIVSYVIEQFRKCSCCGEWRTLDMIGGVDVQIGTEEDIGVGLYSLDELPEFMTSNFTEEQDTYE